MTHRSPGQAPLPFRVSQVPGDMIRTLKYGIMYQIPTVHRVPRLLVAVYVGKADAIGAWSNHLIFYGQDQFGTSYMNPDWIKEVWQVEVELTCFTRNLTRRDLKDNYWRRFLVRGYAR